MPFSKISVLIPTRKRVPRLQTLLKSYEETTRGVESLSEVVFRVDSDDAETKDFVLSLHGPFRLIVGPRLQGYQSMPQFFNEMAELATGDVLLCGNDDMVFKTERWARLILDMANYYPDGLFDIGVATHNETHYPFSIVSKRVVEELGFLWDPRIFWGDIFLRDVMAAFGRCVMMPSVEIEHDWAGNAPDEVFRESDKNITLRDRDYWSGTHARAVSEAVAKLRGLAA